MGYFGDTVKGISWLGGLRLLNRVITFGKTALLARILSPAQFGLFGIASFTLSFVEIVTETGINIYLVQQKKDIDEYINTAWVISIIRGMLIAVVIALSAPLIASFFAVPYATTLILWISLVPLIRGFINPAVAKFTKDLTFHKEFYYRTWIFLVETIVTVIFVVSVQSPLGIVWGMIAGAVFEVLISFLSARPLPQFAFETKLFKNIMHHSKWITLSITSNFLYHNADNMVVGKLLGASSLGIYDMAYKISMLPISEFSDVIVKVTFPVYVKISHDKKRIRNAVLRSTAVVSLIVIPLGCIFFLFSEIIIRILLGERWLGAVDVLRVLALFGVVRAITYSVFAFFYALQRQDIVTYITSVSLVGMLATVVPFITWWGIVGAGYSAVAGALLPTPLVVYYFYKLSK